MSDDKMFRWLAEAPDARIVVVYEAKKGERALHARNADHHFMADCLSEIGAALAADVDEAAGNLDDEEDDDDDT